MMPRLTGADIAQFAEVEHASTGNAAPQSVRDEPSESSVVGRGGAFLDHAFSVATQTTVIESVTEASVGRGGRSLFSNIMESSESFHVIRVDLGGSIQTSSNTSGGASSASIEAMSSSDSRDDSDDIHHPPSSSEGISVSISHTLAPGSLGEISQLPLLT